MVKGHLISKGLVFRLLGGEGPIFLFVRVSILITSYHHTDQITKSVNKKSMIGFVAEFITFYKVLFFTQYHSYVVTLVLVPGFLI